MKSKLFVIVTLGFITLTTSTAYAEDTQDVTFRVFEGNKELENVNVELGGYEKETNENGKVVFEEMPSDIYSYEVDKEGYRSITGNFETRSGEAIIPIELSQSSDDYQLRVGVVGNGSVTVDGEEIDYGWSGVYNEDEQANLEFVPGDGWQVDGIIVNGEKFVYDNLRLFMEKDKDVEVIFGRETVDYYSATSSLEVMDNEILQDKVEDREGIEIRLEPATSIEAIEEGERVQFYVETSRGSENIYMSDDFLGEDLPPHEQGAEENYREENIWNLIGEVNEDGYVSFYVDSTEPGEFELKVGSSFDGLGVAELIEEPVTIKVDGDEDIENEHSANDLFGFLSALLK
ncbi:hypothetical protein [Natranaerobius trueperi]|uniref:Carboxypeptidase regulatory-like domain-containing protein n=1 Tax=Natranaerobius trueperi TaxID=759412 RepID=A0A226BX35_9FIRM|nr:hypothetical protein [Natranaerobius trueperi]OWZ83342.1 hypothetical protein CDO51_08980 [Natranaerobius trueperi]